MNHSMNITDIADKEILQSLQDGFARITGTMVVIVDCYGNTVTAPGTSPHLCQTFCGRKEAPQECPRSIHDLLEQCRENGEMALSRCPCTGLVTAAIPLVGGGCFWGAWLLGQIRFCEIDDPIPSLTEKPGQQCSVVTRKAFQEMMDVLEQINKLLLRLANSHFLARQNAQKKETEEQGNGDFPSPMECTRLPGIEKLLYDIEDYAIQLRVDELFMLTIDLTSMWSFKHLYGQQASHMLLRDIADWIKEQGFPQCSVYHTAEYQFSMLLEAPTPEKAIALAEALRNRFERPWKIQQEGREASWYCLHSIAILQMDEMMAHTELMILVERMLQEATKTQSICFYSCEAVAKMQEEQRLEMALKGDVSDNMRGFSVQYQPIVCASTAGWRGLEALCRWRTKDGKNVSPNVFIREAERIGLIAVIGEWVLETAVEQCKAYGLDQKEGFFLSVNMSSLQIADPCFVNRVTGILERNDFPGHRLTLELTESAELTEGDNLLEMMERLNEHGVTLALDDFGTGYSSLSRLKSIPAQYLKTDRDFIGGIEQDKQAQYYFDIISKLARANNMRLIAEGIETKEQLEIVKGSGADYIQGYYFGKPISADALKAKACCF